MMLAVAFSLAGNQTFDDINRAMAVLEWAQRQTLT
jgi:hypothetical protein